MIPLYERTPGKLSREEVETLCILAAVGPTGCPGGQVATRLGLSPTLAAAVDRGLEPLVSTGLLVRSDQRVDLSDAGRELLRSEAPGAN